MAIICTKPKGSCNNCPHHRWDEERYRMACWKEIDDKNQGNLLLLENSLAKTIELSLTKYIIKGTAHIIDWYEEKGTIEMEPYDISIGNLNKSSIIAGANDSGFGVQKITKIDYQIYAAYEDHLVLIGKGSYNIEDDSSCEKGV